MARVASKKKLPDDPSLGHVEWRPANREDSRETLLRGLERFKDAVLLPAARVRRATTDPKVTLLLGLVEGFKQVGGPPNYVVENVALAREKVDKTDDVWEAVVKVYLKFGVHKHLYECEKEGAPAVCVVRYWGRGVPAVFQLFVQTPTGTGIRDMWPSLTRNYPILRAPFGIPTSRQQSLPLLETAASLPAATAETPSEAASPEQVPATAADEDLAGGSIGSRLTGLPAAPVDAMASSGPTPTAQDRESVGRPAAQTRSQAEGAGPSMPPVPQPPSDQVPRIHAAPTTKPAERRDLYLEYLITYLEVQRDKKKGPSWIWVFILLALIWAIWPGDLRIF